MKIACSYPLELVQLQLHVIACRCNSSAVNLKYICTAYPRIVLCFLNAREHAVTAGLSSPVLLLSIAGSTSREFPVLLSFMRQGVSESESGSERGTAADLLLLPGCLGQQPDWRRAGLQAVAAHQAGGRGL